MLKLYFLVKQKLEKYIRLYNHVLNIFFIGKKEMIFLCILKKKKYQMSYERFKAHILPIYLY